jgi:hypothetical protein
MGMDTGDNRDSHPLTTTASNKNNEMVTLSMRMGLRDKGWTKRAAQLDLIPERRVNGGISHLLTKNAES